MTRLLTVIPDQRDGTSFYRGIVPINHLIKTYPDLDVEHWDNSKNGWWGLTKYHIIFMQRPFNADHKQIASNAKALGCKLWVDYDDNIFDLNDDNPVKEAYKSINATDNIKCILEMADVVSVSTEHLKSVYSEHNDNIHVVPNALNDSIFKKKPEWNKNNFVSWRGGQNHEEDMRQFQPHLTEFCNNRQYMFNMFGHVPYDVQSKINSKVNAWSESILGYHMNLQKDNSSIAIVPMLDNPFNRSKSNCAWLEHTFAGSAVLAPDWEEWQKPGITHYKDKDDFLEKLNSMIDKDLSENLDQSWSYIQDNLRLSKVNALRYQLITPLL